MGVELLNVVGIESWKLLLLCGFAIWGLWSLYREVRFRLAMGSLADVDWTEVMEDMKRDQEQMITAWVPVVDTSEGEVTMVSVKLNGALEFVPLTGDVEALKALFAGPVLPPEGTRLKKIYLLSLEGEEVAIPQREAVEDDATGGGNDEDHT